jgi:hypothetical protein
MKLNATSPVYEAGCMVYLMDETDIISSCPR